MSGKLYKSLVYISRSIRKRVESKWGKSNLCDTRPTFFPRLMRDIRLWVQKTDGPQVVYNNKENPIYTQLSKASDNQGQTKGILKKKQKKKILK